MVHPNISLPNHFIKYNNFGVTGTAEEIELFRKEVKELGWKERFLYSKNLYKLAFLHDGYFNKCPKLYSNFPQISLSNPLGWKEALRLASEVEQQEVKREEPKL